MRTVPRAVWGRDLRRGGGQVQDSRHPSPKKMSACPVTSWRVRASETTAKSKYACDRAHACLCVCLYVFVCVCVLLSLSFSLSFSLGLSVYVSLSLFSLFLSPFSSLLESLCLLISVSLSLYHSISVSFCSEYMCTHNRYKIIRGYIYIYIYISIYIHIYKYIYMYIHIYTHT